MVAYALLICLVIINVVTYCLIDAYFLYLEALHTHVYKSNHYTEQKKLAVKKISNKGYANC